MALFVVVMLLFTLTVAISMIAGTQIPDKLGGERRAVSQDKKRN
jgi:hypothetical protein